MKGFWRNGGKYQALEFGIYPCATRFTKSDGTQFGGGNECVWDKSEMMEYLGSAINLMAYYNHGTFKQHDYGEARVERLSTLGMSYAGTETPTWSDTLIKKYEVIDEVDYLQVGQVSDETFERTDFV